MVEENPHNPTYPSYVIAVSFQTFLLSTLTILTASSEFEPRYLWNEPKPVTIQTSVEPSEAQAWNFLFQRNCKFNFWGENIQPVPWEKFEQSFWDELYSETKTELDEEKNCRNWILFKTRRSPTEPGLENFERSTIWRIYCSATDVSWVVSVGSKRLPNRRTMEKNCSNCCQIDKFFVNQFFWCFVVKNQKKSPKAVSLVKI